MKSQTQRIAAMVSIFVLFYSTTVFAEQGITIKGSDTMVNLGQAWAEAFMEQNPSALIAVTGGGSGTGIAALINGTCDITQSSREMKKQELEMAKQNGHEVQEFKVAIDALAVIVHPSNSVGQLTIDQLSDIFTAKITNWKEMGGADQPITVLSRERNSGTHVYFLEHVVRKGNEKGPEEFAPTVLMMSSSQAIAEEVAGSRGAIGYLGIGYVNDRHKKIAVSKSVEGPFVLPSVETALDKTYPIARPLLLYTVGKPQELIQAFLDFVLSNEGQAIVLDMQFVPLQQKPA
ncbi:MAG: hypothetical protein A3C35_05525 [Omnitrophica bacterium RIFCSPHIGHO2_02_FULL_46_11]|nr:MAG: hypothetical protein A3C35_05525 [Omnitrophica bacterium RIFCSPHIGHO2_02_FULL_46_11]OGW87975.1 MAG: hypothetical protein A3A81_06690 [Omnitrophica bacterium RIFCSPLOWO2_01_FULL_45_10b]